MSFVLMSGVILAGTSTVGNYILTSTIGRLYSYVFPPGMSKEELLLSEELAKNNTILEKLKRIEIQQDEILNRQSKLT